VAETTTPRAMIRAILRGEPLPRPLLLPIVFAMGARLEDLSLRAFQSNPTKIAHSLRQIRNTLGLDGVSCYFDPFLEAEALGCRIDWNADDSRCVVHARAENEADPHLAVSVEGVPTRGRIPVACDVLRRLKMMLQGEPALMIRVTGPLKLAAQLREGACAAGLNTAGLNDFAAGVAAAVSRSFLEAGANVIFLQEDPDLIEDAPHWASMLAPVVNAIRFYEALPVLLLQGQLRMDAVAALNASCGGVICPRAIDLGSQTNSPSLASGSAICRPSACFLPTEDPGSLRTILQSLVQDSTVSIVTSDGDIPERVDIRYLASVLGTLRSLSRKAA